MTMPGDLEPSRIRASDADRDRVIVVLNEAHAAGRLGIDELDERQSRVLAARFIDELWPAISDLPESSAVRDLAPGQQMVPAPVDRSPATGRPERLDFALMSGRTVVVEPGTERVQAYQLMGGDDYDLSSALGPGVTVTFNIVAVMAGSNIYVPEGVRVVDNTVSIMAGNDIEVAARGDGSKGTLVLKGFSFWAGHDVKLAPQR